MSDVPQRMAMSTAKFRELMGRAAAFGDYRLPRREGSDHITPIEHMTATNMTRVEAIAHTDAGIVNTADPDFLSAAEMEGHRQAYEYARFLVEQVPGYERASLVSMSTQIGVREIRRVYGDYRLSGDDVMGAHQFDDQVGLSGAPLEDHHPGGDTKWVYLPDGTAVGIPYRTLIVRDAVNVLMAGRLFRATHDAQAAVRSMAQCMAMGQAAGTAAALSIRHGGDPRAVPWPALRDGLLGSGAVLTMDQAQAA